MAECPLPKPNTRVRFPSPAPKIDKFRQKLVDFSFVSALADTTSLGEAHIILSVSENIIVCLADTKTMLRHAANEVLRNEDATLA